MNIKSISSALGICACAGLLSSNAYAATIIDRNIGLTSPDIVIDFENPDIGVGVGDIINTQFESFGVTFGPTFVYGIAAPLFPPRPALDKGHLANINGVQPGSIFFSSDVTGAAFSWRTANFSIGANEVETHLSAYNDNVLVEELSGFSDISLPTDSGRYFGFESSNPFDEIRISLLVEGTMDLSPDTTFTLDNLEYISAIPVPAAAWLFASGLLGLIGVARRKS